MKQSLFFNCPLCLTSFKCKNDRQVKRAAKKVTDHLFDVHKLTEEQIKPLIVTITLEGY